MIEISELMLNGLREQLAKKISPKRFAHTLAVEEMVARLCAVYCSQYTMQLRAAALLHDITKELTTEEQIALCQRFGLSVTKTDVLSPKTFHARTAAELIVAEYPEFADPLIVNAVRWHTTGRKAMTLCEQLLYLADYIDASRTFDSCVLLRKHFWDAKPQNMSEAERLKHLYQTMVYSFDLTIEDLLESGVPIAEDTILARNEFLLLLSESF